MKARSELVLAGLLALTAVPVIAGAARVAQLTGGATVTPENARFFAQPVPVIVHIFSASTYCIVGAFQFSSGLRRRWPVWHRWARRFLAPSGISAALAGLWMTIFYPRPPADDLLLEAFRIVFGSAMIACIVLGFLAIRRADVAAHRAWMTRGYAIALGAGTQVLTNLPWMLLVGKSATGLSRALLLGAGWVINLAVAEWLLRRRRSKPTRRALVRAA